MSNSHELGPFGDIVQVVRMPDGALLAYDASHVLIVELDEDGLEQLRTMVPGIRVIDALDRDKAKSLSFGLAYGGGVRHNWLHVRVVATSAVFLGAKTCPLVVDGVRLNKGDKVLITAQPDPKDNRLWEVWRTDQSLSGHSWVPCDPVKAGDLVLVKNGVTLTDSVWSYNGKAWSQILEDGSNPFEEDDVSAAFALLGASSPPKAKPKPQKLPPATSTTVEDALECLEAIAKNDGVDDMDDFIADLLG